jgi:hypothetical protein
MPARTCPGRGALRGVGEVVLAALVLVGSPLPSVGQDPGQDPGLDRVESLAAVGRVGEARDALTQWWENGRSEAPRAEVQRGLWLRAVLTVDRSLAELDFHRLALEFPTGPYASMAVVRLGYGAEAAGDWETAAQHFERVLRDYPDAPEAREARTWLDGWEERSRRWARSDDPVTEHPSGTYAVQLGAFRDVERARTVEDQARDVGLRPRVVQVPGTDLIRVRVGRFLTSREASEAMERIRGMGLDATVAVDADRERAVAR